LGVGRVKMSSSSSSAMVLRSIEDEIGGIRFPSRFGDGERLIGVGGGDEKPSSRASSKLRSSILRTVGSLRYLDRRRSWLVGLCCEPEVLRMEGAG